MLENRHILILSNSWLSAQRAKAAKANQIALSIEAGSTTFSGRKFHQPFIYVEIFPNIL